MSFRYDQQYALRLGTILRYAGMSGWYTYSEKMLQAFDSADVANILRNHGYTVHRFPHFEKSQETWEFTIDPYNQDYSEGKTFEYTLRYASEFSVTTPEGLELRGDKTFLYSLVEQNELYPVGPLLKQYIPLSTAGYGAMLKNRERYFILARTQGLQVRPISCLIKQHQKTMTLQLWPQYWNFTFTRQVPGSGVFPLSASDPMRKFFGEKFKELWDKREAAAFTILTAKDEDNDLHYALMDIQWWEGVDYSAQAHQERREALQRFADTYSLPILPPIDDLGHEEGAFTYFVDTEMPTKLRTDSGFVNYPIHSYLFVVMDLIDNGYDVTFKLGLWHVLQVTEFCSFTIAKERITNHEYINVGEVVSVYARVLTKASLTLDVIKVRGLKEKAEPVESATIERLLNS